MSFLDWISLAILWVYYCLAMDYCCKILERKHSVIVVLVLAPAIIAGTFFTQKMFSVPIPILYIAALAVFFLALKVCFKGKTLSLYWAAMNFTFHLLALKGIVLALFSLVLNMNMFRIIEDETMSSFALLITMLVMSIFLMVFNSRVDVGKIKTLLGNTGQLRYVYTLQTVLFCFLIFCTYSYYYNLDLVWFTIFHLLSCLFGLVGFYLIFNMAVRTAIWVEEELHYEFAADQMKKQLERHEDQQRMIELVRRYKHDFSHMTNNLTVLLNENKVKEAQTLLLEMGDYEEVDLAGHKEYSNNLIVDIVLTELATECEKEGITFTAQCFIPEEISLNSLQLSRLFNNLAANALEACRRQTPDTNQWIDIKGRLQEGKVIVSARNSFNGTIMMSVEKELLTLKSNKAYHGLGIKNIKSIIEGQGGYSEIKITEAPHVFEFFIVLPIAEAGGL